MIISLPTKRVSAISQWKSCLRVLCTRWRRKPAGIDIMPLSPSATTYTIFTKFLYTVSTAVARSSTSGAVIFYVLSVLNIIAWRRRRKEGIYSKSLNKGQCRFNSVAYIQTDPPVGSTRPNTESVIYDLAHCWYLCGIRLTL